MGKNPKINKRGCSFISYMRVWNFKLNNPNFITAVVRGGKSRLREAIYNT